MKTKRKSAVRLLTNCPSCLPSGQEVARWAYILWEREGRPPGRDVVHWLQAEAQLQRGLQQEEVPA